MTLVTMLRKYDRELKKYCKEQIRSHDMSNGTIWVTDNFRTCSSAIKAAVGFLSREGEKDLKPLFFMCKDFFEKGERVSSDKIAARFSGEKLNVFQCEALKVLLYAAASCVICESLYDETKEELIVSCVKNLIKLRETDFETLFYDICAVERYLCEDPAEIYEKMSADTKKQYRNAVRKAADKENVSETEYAKKVLAFAEKDEKHIGFYLTVNKDKSRMGLIYIISEWVISILISCLMGFFLVRKLYSPLFLVFPVYAILKPLSDKIAAKVFAPYKLPSLSENAINDSKTLITVSSLLPSAAKAGELFGKLSDIYSSDSLKGTKVMLLVDLRNSRRPEEASDKADIQAIKRLIDELNQKHGRGFLVAVRDRVYSPGENEYTGYERKRGAISSLCGYLRDGNADRFSVVYGDTEGLREMKYIMALDSDTSMSFEVLRDILAVAEHPLNEPVFSNIERRVVSGYGIIAPRVETSIVSAGKTVFSSIFTNGGLVLYSPTVSERYMDMFGNSIFSGKGLINIDAFNFAAGEKFDEQRILSHDILEGGVLRTAFSPDTALTDSFPSGAEGYFSRQHRWIRGDVQNLRYIFYPLGKKDAAPEMPNLGKYQLFDNFRRALTPINAILLLFLSCVSFFDVAFIYVTVGVLSVISHQLISLFCSVVKRGMSVFSSLYFSAELTTFYKDILRSLADIGSLPENAFVNADAIVRSFYRCIISHKKLLQWTTAADAEKKTGNNILRALVFPLLTAVIFFLFGSSFLRLCSVMILCYIPLALSDGISMDTDKEKELSSNERSIITSFAAAGWRFFEENVTAAENHLPPDNIQETPVPRKAGRTSPTNIGFYLVSVLAAADMSFITSEELFNRINSTVDTVIRLPKYKGLLYNWYDIYKMTPLPPSYISSVDEGNFLVCLTALKEGLKEYKSLHCGMDGLINKIEDILDSSDLTPLYDETRQLFRIGLDAATGKPSASYYDLYMSEARLTSYYECARRHTSARHWKNLDRALNRNNGHLTAASWTGTMFEYFLPPLFFGSAKNSFQYETLKSALFFQKKRAERENIPYGISESCFYSVDNLLNYRYKAHGLKELALKREADDESVVSPYSVFLTLPFDKKSAMKALDALSALHCEGKYGFYEAVDFCKARTDGEDYAVVRCYMSHHLGMSIIAMANTLNDNIFVKRFMADDDMRSARSLLEEKIPSHPVGVSSLHSEKRKKTVREQGNKTQRNAPEEGTQVFAYSNGELTLFCDKYGRNTSVFSSSRLYKFTKLSEGISCAYEYNGNVKSLFPDYSNSVKLNKYALTVKDRTEDIEIISAFAVHPSENALLIPIKITNTADEDRNIKLHFYFEPELLKEGREDMHPAFSDMFLDVKKDNRRSCITFFRKGSKDMPSVSVGFYGKRKFIFSLDREEVTARKHTNIFCGDFNIRMNPVRGISPVAAVSTQVSVPSGKSAETVLVISVGADADSSEYILSSVRSRALPVITKCAAATFLRDKLTFSAACSLIARHFFGAEDSEITETAKSALKSGRSSLWKIGISGETPVVTVFADRNCPVLIQEAFVKLYKRLKKASVSAELVFIFESPPDYGCTAQRELKKIITNEDMTDCLSKDGGIHLFYLSELPKDSFTSLIAFSVYVYPDEKNEILLPRKKDVVSEKAIPLYDGDGGFIKNGYAINKKPLLPWCHTLSNNTFGTLISDSSIGYSWCYNSRQNKLTPWSNNTAEDLDGEKLYIKIGEEIFDIISDSGTVFYDTSAVYRCKVNNLLVVSVINIAEKGARKRIRVFIKNMSEKETEAAVCYCVFPVLGERNSDGKFTKIYEKDRCVFAENYLNEDFPGVLCLASDSDNAEVFDNMKTVTGSDVKALVILQKFVADDKDAEVHFDMTFGKNAEVARKIARLPFTAQKGVSLKFETGYPRFDEFSSALLLHQVRDTRLRARCGFYQCSGAFGFRDQLQDAISLTGIENRKVRQMIFRAASAQFSEGDVLHWFHPIFRERLIYKGVRTRCSDDLLWLPYAVARYVNETGDRSILDKNIPYLCGELLHPEQNECYNEFTFSEEKGSLYEHCMSAIRYSYKTGIHSLPLIGTGDWNDSFDKVGEKGKGESVWLGMFMKKVFVEFAKICELNKDKKSRKELLDASEQLTSAIEENAWNGKWYIRAFYDDGSPLGDEGADSCEIDLLCQAWASLSGMPDKNRVKTALLSAYEKLFSEKDGIVKLFTPPFNEKSKTTGYVNLYPEGMRENGGQYTHAAVWFLTALFNEGLKEEAEKVLYSLLPSEKYKTGNGEVFRTEPYALPGDVYSAEGHEGRGGWSLYTGSAGWLLQLAKQLSERHKEQNG